MTALNTYCSFAKFDVGEKMKELLTWMVLSILQELWTYGGNKETCFVSFGVTIVKASTTSLPDALVTVERCVVYKDKFTQVNK